jgi:hypothetical protein
MWKLNSSHIQDNTQRASYQEPSAKTVFGILGLMLHSLFKPKEKKKQAFHYLQKRLHHHHRRAVSRLHTTHKHVAHLAKKHGVPIHKLREHAHRAAATAVLSTSLMAAVPAVDVAKQKVGEVQAAGGRGQTVERPIFPAIETVEAAALPGRPVPEVIHEAIGDPRSHTPHVTLTPEQEQRLSEIFLSYYGVPASAELEGKRLNVVYGLIGGEQHLKRYPGDTVAAHKNNIDQRPELAGIAPGLGGWGYFAPSKAEFDADPIHYEREKFYIAAQTFLAPGWKENVMGMSRWFKFRKVLVVNPLTGQGCVAVIGDAGPGISTKKNFGGSPEVMDAVGWSKGSRKGPVIVYFVDDPDNRIPLGHINPGDHLTGRHQ